MPRPLITPANDPVSRHPTLAVRSTRRSLIAVAVATFIAAAASAARNEGTSASSVGNRPSAGDSAPASALDDDAVVASIDRRLRASWRAARITPSAKAPDDAWARRVYIDLLGRVPTVEELDRFGDVKVSERRATLVATLLGDEHRTERARWLATEWANLLVGRTGGTNGDSLVHRPSLVRYLRERMLENAPYDRLMRELVTARGSVRPDDPDHNGAANFLADKMDENGVQATAKTAQLFLGVAVQCTQCHDHPFNEQKQNQFWELNAFFRQARVERLREEDGNRAYARLVDYDFAGEGPRPPIRAGTFDRAETYYEVRNGKLQVAYPVFLDGSSLEERHADRGAGFGDSGRVEDVNRRQELAALVADSPDFARAAVNREWGRLLGYGFTRPADDMGPHNPPVLPELLDELADAYRASGYDTNRLVGWIARTEAYGLDSRAGRSNEADDPSQGSAPVFSRFYLRQLSAEQIYESLLTATRADRALGEDERDDARRRWLRQFATAFGNDENGEATSFNGSIPQALALMNSDLVRRATELDAGMKRGPAKRSASYGKPDAKPQGGFLAETAANPELDNAQRVTRLYMAALARRPTPPELSLCNDLLAARKGNAGEAMRDIWWALLNSNEFILQH
ncbi:MAG: DUF1549 domain-containing protein [Lacipirellulaceae bacterium]